MNHEQISNVSTHHSLTAVRKLNRAQKYMQERTLGPKALQYEITAIMKHKFSVETHNVIGPVDEADA